MGKNNYALHVLFYNLAVRAATSKASAAIPKKLSQFENDSKFLTDEALKEFAKDYQKSLTAGDGISIEGEKISSVTPFKYAEKNGYTGTEEEFVALFMYDCKEEVAELKGDLSDKVDFSKPQSLTAQQQTQAQSNIGIHKVTQAEYDALTDTSGIYIIVEE